MELVCGIYGYQITHTIEIGGFRIVPRTNDFTQATEWASDRKSYQLTAVILAESISDNRLFYLEAILSFIERMDIIITSPQELDNTDPFLGFVSSITSHKRSSGGGAAILSDTFSRDSRKIFISKALEKLEDDIFCEKTQFRVLFFKCVESFRQVKNFVEIEYFLLYSGLESYARAVTGDRNNKNSSEPICELLVSYGFDIKIERPNNLTRAVSTYTHLRNALFHNGEFIKIININGTQTELKLFDYLFNFSQLVSLVILKAVEFDDKHINWNSWVDRQPFR